MGSSNLSRPGAVGDWGLGSGSEGKKNNSDAMSTGSVPSDPMSTCWRGRGYRTVNPLLKLSTSFFLVIGSTLSSWLANHTAI
ncbi:unnamed protein product [Prunus armeniaca]